MKFSIRVDCKTVATGFRIRLQVNYSSKFHYK